MRHSLEGIVHYLHAECLEAPFVGEPVHRGGASAISSLTDYDGADVVRNCVSVIYSSLCTRSHQHNQVEQVQFAHLCSIVAARVQQEC